MNAKLTLRTVLLSVLIASGVSVHLASQAHASIGTPVANAEMPRLQGGKAPLLQEVEANVLVFFRPHQERSLALLKELAQCQIELHGKTVSWVGIVPAGAPVEEVVALTRETRFSAPVLLDQDDALYTSLGLVMHPVVAIVGSDKKLAAFEPFRSVDFCAVVGARLRNAMHQISDSEMGVALDPPKSVQGGEEQVARRYRALAEAMFRNRNYDKAMDYVRKSLAKDPRLAAAHALQGQILQAQGNCAQAAPIFTQALALDADSTAAREGLESCKTAR